MRKILLFATVSALAFSAQAADWQEVEHVDGLYKSNAVSIKSQSSEETLTIYRKHPKAVRAYPKEMVFINFKTEGLDQINSGGPVIYKADKGKAYPLGATARTGRMTGAIDSTAFHGKPSATCGIVGNMSHSDKLTVRYETTGRVVKDVVFDLPKNNDPLFKLLGFDETKDCIEIN